MAMRWRRSSLAIVWMALASVVAHAQTVPRGGAMEYVGIERDKPFSADRVTKPASHPAGGTGQTRELVEHAARDSAGRIRIERNHAFPPVSSADEVELSSAEGKNITAKRATLGLNIVISDYANGQSIQLLPAMQIARTRTIPKLTPGGPGDRPFSSHFGGRAGPNTEDLGEKEIAGFLAHGYKQTQFGKEEDGEWNGKPIREWERWVSDELAVTLIETVRDLKNNQESTSELTNIKREEPDASLFEIPAGFMINPTTEQMPRIIGNGKPTSQP